jgi:small subunit ribosomal protein S15
MSLSIEDKSRIINKFGRSEADTGSSEVQIALLTADIERLTEHFKIHKQDNHSRRGLMHKVNLRRKLLDYLNKKNPEKYAEIVLALNLRG